MAKVYGLSQIELREGVKPEDFEKFIVEEWYALPPPEGVSQCLVKGDKGRNEGQYAWLMETESVERRDELFPRGQGWSDEFQRWVDAHAAVVEKWQSMVTLPFYTDYVVIE